MVCVCVFLCCCVVAAFGAVIVFLDFQEDTREDFQDSRENFQDPAKIFIEDHAKMLKTRAVD